jgi:hypothetical protein
VWSCNCPSRSFFFACVAALRAVAKVGLSACYNAPASLASIVQPSDASSWQIFAFSSSISWRFPRERAQSTSSHNLLSSALGRRASLRRFSISSRFCNSLANLLPWIICACVYSCVVACERFQFSISPFSLQDAYTNARTYHTFDTDPDTDTDKDRHRPQAGNASQD